MNYVFFLRNYLNEESQKSNISDPFPIQPTKKHRLIEKGQELYSNKLFVEDLEKKQSIIGQKKSKILPNKQILTSETVQVQNQYKVILMIFSVSFRIIKTKRKMFGFVSAIIMTTPLYCQHTICS